MGLPLRKSDAVTSSQEWRAWHRTIERINDRVREAETYRTQPEFPMYRLYQYQYWNIQDDREAFGHLRPSPFPHLVIRFDDGRTWWDELRVLEFVFCEDRSKDAV